MANRSQGSIVVSRGAPLPPYIKEQGEGVAGQEGARHVASPHQDHRRRPEPRSGLPRCWGT